MAPSSSVYINNCGQCLPKWCHRSTFEKFESWLMLDHIITLKCLDTIGILLFRSKHFFLARKLETYIMPEDRQISASMRYLGGKELRGTEAAHGYGNTNTWLVVSTYLVLVFRDGSNSYVYLPKHFYIRCTNSPKKSTSFHPCGVWLWSTSQTLVFARSIIISTLQSLLSEVVPPWFTLNQSFA